MNPSTNRAPGVVASAGQPAFPVRVSPNGRYIVDANGKPVFWLGTTQWELLHGHTLEGAELILQRSIAHGFIFAQAMLTGVGDGTVPNVHGQKVWVNDDPLTPNEEYFKHVDAVLRLPSAGKVAVVLMMYHQLHTKHGHITLANARPWAKWVAQRYKDLPQIIWSMAPQAKEEIVPVLRELAAGLREGDGGNHLITVHPDPSPYSSSFIHTESWLDFNSMQPWKDVNMMYSMITKDYNLKPVKPTLMAEGAYESGPATKYKFEVTPLWIRRQAYYSFIAGAHHTYGFNDSYKILPAWKQDLDSPGAIQMGILKRIFTARKEWWLLVPDQSVLASGGHTEGDVLHLAARHKDGKWVMVYLADATLRSSSLRSTSKASFSVQMDKLAADDVSAMWVNPATGDVTPIGRLSNKGQRAFTTPDGWEDAILVLETADTTGKVETV